MGSGDDGMSRGNAAATMRAGVSGSSRQQNIVERMLTAVYRVTRIGWLAEQLRGNATLCAISWFFLILGGVAHVCRHFGGESATSLVVETVATVVVYALVGTSEFVDVSYEIAVGNVNIHVLTTLAVLGTVALGCALEAGAQRLGSRLWGVGLRVKGLGYRLWGVGFGVKGLGSGLWGVGFRIKGLGSGLWGVGLGVKGLGSRVWGVGLGVKGLGSRLWGVGLGVKGLGSRV
jgi:hypothetical protein